MQTSQSWFHWNALHLKQFVAILRVGGDMNERRGTPLLFQHCISEKLLGVALAQQRYLLFTVK